MKKGENIICIDCSKEFILNRNTFWMDADAEYITCPYCKKTHDVNVYHFRDILKEKIKNSLLNH